MLGQLDERLWSSLHSRAQNTQLLDSDVAAAIALRRAAPGGEIRVWGSTELVRLLAQRDLVDEYRLAVYPLVLGSGKRLSTDGFAPTRLAVSESRALASGVVVTRYRRGGEV